MSAAGEARPLQAPVRTSALPVHGVRVWASAEEPTLGLRRTLWKRGVVRLNQLWSSNRARDEGDLGRALAREVAKSQGCVRVEGTGFSVAWMPAPVPSPMFHFIFLY